MPVTQKLACTVERIVNHGERVYTVALRPEHLVPRFRAGQFLHFALDPYDPSRFWPESRVFSIASSPTQRDLLHITYSVRGRFTARMEQELVEGRQVWIKMPYGEFVIDSRADAVLFAGGTGIAAFTAFLDSLAPETRQPVTLAYGARSRRLWISRDVVERCAQLVSSVDAVYFVEEPATDDRTELGVGFDAQPGRVSVAAMWPRLSRPLASSYYISGPPGMLHAVAQDLRAYGISSEAIHIDAWE
jgi:ferredoxin-NADP reductase